MVLDVNHMNLQMTAEKMLIRCFKTLMLLILQLHFNYISLVAFKQYCSVVLFTECTLPCIFVVYFCTYVVPCVMLLYYVSRHGPEDLTSYSIVYTNCMED